MEFKYIYCSDPRVHDDVIVILIASINPCLLTGIRKLDNKSLSKETMHNIRLDNLLEKHTGQFMNYQLN